MKKKILIIFAFPEKSGLAETLAEYYVRGVKESGKGEVSLINLSEIEFDPILWGGYNTSEPLEKSLREAQKEIKKADHLTFFYPLWWSDMPALLKGFLEKVLLPGFAFRFESEGGIKKLLTGKNARLVVTMHSSPEEYMQMTDGASDKIFSEGILNFCGIKTTGVNHIGPVYKANEQQKNNWFELMKTAGKNDSESDGDNL